MCRILQSVFLAIGLLAISCQAGTYYDFSNCPDSVKKNAVVCTSNFNAFFSELMDVDFDDYDAVIEFNKTCRVLDACNAVLSCAAKTREVLESTIEYANECHTKVFLRTEFKECDMKLRMSRAKCYNKWNPMVTLFEKKPVADDCFNFFGSDNCMKDEIIKTCGHPMWAKFWKHYDKTNPILWMCDMNYPSLWL